MTHHPSLAPLLFAWLPATLHGLLSSTGTFVTLSAGQVLQVAHAPVEFIYFLTTGGCQLLGEVEGDVAEAGFLAQGGVVGSIFSMAGQIAPVRAVMLSDGTAIRVAAEAYQRLIEEYPRLRQAIGDHNSQVCARSQQLAACNLLHNLDQRVCRWLLQTAAATNDSRISLKQQTLAFWLGVTRARVNQTLKDLERSGVISHIRGAVVIEHADRLALRSCACSEMLGF